MDRPRSPASPDRRRVALRIGFGLAVSVLLHVVLIGIAVRKWSPAAIEADGDTPATTIEARIEPLPATPQALPATVPPRALPPAPKPRVAPPPAPVPTPSPALAPAPADTPAPTAPSAIASATPADAAAAATGPVTPDAANPTADYTLATGWTIRSFPPNGTLHFTALRTEPDAGDRKTYGRGELRWSREGDRYAIEQELGLDLIFTTFRLQHSTSSGRAGPLGLVPERYVEARRTRDETITSFDRDSVPPMVRFSAADAPPVALPPDAQDRASAMFQLSLALRNLPERPQPGDLLELSIAGVRRIDTWRFVYEGEDQVDTGLGPLEAVRVVRKAQPATKDPQVEIWYAPQQEWLPVRIRYTETSGDILDLVVRGWTPETPPDPAR